MPLADGPTQLFEISHIGSTTTDEEQFHLERGEICLELGGDLAWGREVDGVVRGQAPVGAQVWTQRPGPQAGLPPAPTLDLPVVTPEQHGRDLATSKARWACVVGVLENLARDPAGLVDGRPEPGGPGTRAPVADIGVGVGVGVRLRLRVWKRGEALVCERVRVAQDPLAQPGDGLDDQRGGDLSTVEHKIPDRQTLVDPVLPDPVVDALVAPTQERDPRLEGEALGDTLIETRRRGRQQDRMHRATLGDHGLERGDHRPGLDDHARAPAKGGGVDAPVAVVGELAQVGAVQANEIPGQRLAHEPGLDKPGDRSGEDRENLELERGHLRGPVEHVLVDVDEDVLILDRLDEHGQDRQQPLPAAQADHKQILSAVAGHADHLTERLETVAVPPGPTPTHGPPDEIVEVVLVGLELGQLSAIDIQLPAAQGVGGLACIDALEPQTHDVAAGLGRDAGDGHGQRRRTGSIAVFGAGPKFEHDARAQRARLDVVELYTQGAADTVDTRDVAQQHMLLCAFT